MVDLHLPSFLAFALICLVGITIESKIPHARRTDVSGIVLKRALRNHNSDLLNQAINSAKDTVGKLGTHENNLDAAEIKIKPGSPFFAQMLDTAPTEEAAQFEQDSMIAVRTAVYLLHKYCPTNFMEASKKCVDLIAIDLNGTELYDRYKQMYHVACNAKEKYRTIDGSCNNVNRTYLGKSNTVYGRLLQSDYDDGLHEMRGHLSNTLPNPRLISTTLTTNHSVPEKNHTILTALWGLLVYHDVSFTPVRGMVHLKNPIMCCNLDGGSLLPRYSHASCAPINIPKVDPFFGVKHQTCMNYVRSLPGLRTDGKLGPMEQMNQVTHFLDASFLYGSTSSYARSIRTLEGGKLIDADQSIKKCFKVGNSSSVCYEDGNSRIMFVPQLRVVQLIFLNEHNKIADSLASINKKWSDEKIYQETRRIIIAVFQHITYNHWLPVLLGEKFVKDLNVTSTKKSHVDYNSDVEPVISNAVATAAFPSLNSMLDNFIKLYKEDGTILKETHLRDHIVEDFTDKNYIDQLVKSMITQNAQKLDTKYADTLTKYWYSISGDFGVDALSLDIQRGRDHGLPGYVKFRKYCNLSEIKTFDDLNKIIHHEDVRKLRTLYENVADIDLLVGIISEKQLEDALVGPTLQCLLGNQFKNTRTGDRYFFDHTANFNEAQLSQIKRCSLARIFCDNSGIATVQSDVFTVSDESRNKLHSCKDSTMVKTMKFDSWKVIANKDN